MYAHIQKHNTNTHTVCVCVCVFFFSFCFLFGMQSGCPKTRGGRAYSDISLYLFGKDQIINFDNCLWTTKRRICLHYQYISGYCSEGDDMQRSEIEVVVGGGAGCCCCCC